MPIAWHPSRYWHWCMSEKEKKETEIVGINMDFFLYLVTRYKSFLAPKEVQIKMSSLLSVPIASNKSEGFSFNDIEVLVDSKDQNWFKRAHMG